MKIAQIFALLITLVILFLLLSFFIKQDNEREAKLKSAVISYGKMCAEYAYYEGQREALDGDVRIIKDQTGTYVWSKSPWNEDTTKHIIPSDVYNPKIPIDKNMDRIGTK